MCNVAWSRQSPPVSTRLHCTRARISSRLHCTRARISTRPHCTRDSARARRLQYRARPLLFIALRIPFNGLGKARFAALILSKPYLCSPALPARCLDYRSSGSCSRSRARCRTEDARVLGGPRIDAAAHVRVGPVQCCRVQVSRHSLVGHVAVPKKPRSEGGKAADARAMQS